MRTGRREFLLMSAAARLAAAENGRKLLLPSDTPDEFGFRLMWHSAVPPIDVSKYQLKVGGLVEKPVELSVADLNKFRQEKQSSRMKCVQCWSARTTWGGFRFQELIEAAKPTKAAKAVRIDCVDKWYEHFTIEELTRPNVMMVLEMGGKPLADRHGAPLRLIDPARYGYKCAKLITSIDFVAEMGGSMACDTGPYYTPGGEIKEGYDHPLDLGPGVRKKIPGGEITEY